MKDFSCRFDSFCFILVYKLIYQIELLYSNNCHINLLKEFSTKLKNLNKSEYSKGFFNFYENLDNIKKNLNSL